MIDNIVVYEHRRLDTNEIFYVGIGGGKRPQVTGNRNKFWRRVVKKAGYSVEVIEDCLTWEQACEIEIMLIAHYGRRDLGKGPLVNLTDGGDGMPGYKHTDEAKAKMRALKIGKPLSPEHIAKVTATLIGRPVSEETRAKLSAVQKGAIFSEEHRAKMSAAAKARWANRATKNILPDAGS